VRRVHQVYGEVLEAHRRKRPADGMRPAGAPASGSRSGP
jgi:hypothetical protein